MTLLSGYFTTIFLVILEKKTSAHSAVIRANTVSALEPVMKKKTAVTQDPGGI